MYFSLMLKITEGDILDLEEELFFTGEKASVLQNVGSRITLKSGRRKGRFATYRLTKVNIST